MMILCVSLLFFLLFCFTTPHFVLFPDELLRSRNIHRTSPYELVLLAGSVTRDVLILCIVLFNGPLWDEIATEWHVEDELDALVPVRHEEKHPTGKQRGNTKDNISEVDTGATVMGVSELEVTTGPTTGLTTAESVWVEVTVGSLPADLSPVDAEEVRGQDT